jgi:hypothetical protein
MGGYKPERRRAREYLGWLIDQVRTESQPDVVA